MTNLSISDLPIIDDEEANSRIKESFEEIQRLMGIPFVPNLFRVTANSENVLLGTWELMKNVYLNANLPKAITAMILYHIAESNNCAYCGSIHKVTCQTLGINEETLAALANDLTALNPLRVQAIVKFANKAAYDAHGLTEADFENLRDHGVTDEEITEIIGVAAIGNYFDTIADAMKIPVDAPIQQALQG